MLKHIQKRQLQKHNGKKESLDTTIKLPNGKITTITGAKGVPMAIYQVGLRANNDYETEGTPLLFICS